MNTLDSDILKENFEWYSLRKFRNRSVYSPEYVFEEYKTKTDYLAPSRFWGERLGIDRLYNSYSAVLGDKHAEIQGEGLHLMPFTTLIKLFADLIHFYPELKTIHDYENNIHSIVYGCVSQFNVPDIEYFVTVPFVDRPDILEIKKACIELKLGYSLEWIVSEYTINLFAEKLFVSDFS